MATVYQFRVWDPAKGETMVQPSKSTEERIRSVGGEIIPDTAEDVPDDALDTYGRYDPAKGTNSSRQGAYAGGGYGVAGGYGTPSAHEDAFDEEAFDEGLFATSSAKEAQNAPISQGSTLIADATVVPQPPVAAASQIPVAGTAPASRSSSGPQQTPSYISGEDYIRERPTDIVSICRALAKECDVECERARHQRSNEQPEQTDAYLDFLQSMSTKLNALADAIYSAFIQPQPGEPIFTSSIQNALSAVGADFFRFLKENSDSVYRVGLFGGMAAFLTYLGVSEAAGFVSGLALGTHAAKK